MEQKNNAVDNPRHYHGDSVINVIEEFGLSFALGNSVKYILRADLKGKPVEDLQKARWYLDREIANRLAVSSEKEPKEETVTIPVPPKWAALLDRVDSKGALSTYRGMDYVIGKRSETNLLNKNIECYTPFVRIPDGFKLYNLTTFNEMISDFSIPGTDFVDSKIKSTKDCDSGFWLEFLWEWDMEHAILKARKAIDHILLQEKEKKKKK